MSLLFNCMLWHSTLIYNDHCSSLIYLGCHNGSCLSCPLPVAVVGLERTFYSVSEGDPVVTVCAVVYMPDTTVSCPISFPFSVALSTDDITARNLSVYIVCTTLPSILTSRGTHGLWTAGGSLAGFRCMPEEQLCGHTHCRL